MFGVQIICAIHLISAILVIGNVSSMARMDVMGVEISSSIQIVYAAWSLFGIPIIVGAAVGALYRIEYHLRVYYWYLWACLLINVIWSVTALVSGRVCSAVASHDVQTMGSAFVCGFIDTIVFVWFLMNNFVLVYCIYIVWSDAECMKDIPELAAYRKMLNSAQPSQPASGFTPTGGPQLVQGSQPPMYGSLAPGGAPVGIPVNSMGPGAPQSFVPAPY